MRLYRTTGFTFSTDGQGAQVINTSTMWSGTQAAAASDRRVLNSQGCKRSDIVTEEIEVPTVKKELVKFLNDGGLNG